MSAVTASDRVAELVPTVRGIARAAAVGRPYLDADELESDAMLALALADQRFKDGSHERFAPFAIQRVKWAIIDSIRNQLPVSRTGRRRRVESAFSLDQHAADGKGGEIDEELHNLFADENDSVTQHERLDLVVSALRRIKNERYRRVAADYFLTGSTLREVGEREGVSESRVSQMIAKGLEPQRWEALHAA
jgi:RNA polymerase sigma factor (sigma-70 family)